MKKFIKTLAQVQLSTSSILQGDFVALCLSSGSELRTPSKFKPAKLRLFSGLICFLFAFFAPFSTFSQCNCTPNYSTYIPIDGCPPNILLYSQIASSISSSVPVFLTGTLIIDVPASLMNYTFLMGEDAEIRINPGMILTLNSCTLKAACNTLWSRIYLDGANTTLQVFGGVVRDAVYGLWSQNSAKIVTNGVRFEDNIYNVRLRLGIPAPNLSSFKGCTFTSTTAMLLPSANASAQLLSSVFTTLPIRPYVGIEGLDCSPITIGDPTGVQNIFEKMDFGIRINRNSTIIKNNLFRNINRFGMNNTTTGDKAAIVYEGVDADNVKIKIGGDLLYELNIIEDCANGYIGTGCTRQLI